MGCGGSRNGSEVTESCVDLEGLTGEALQTAMRTHNVKSKWKSHKAPIDMDLLKELGLAGDEDDEPGGGDSKTGNGKAESEKAKSVGTAKSASVKSAKTSMKSGGAEEEKVEQTENG